MGSRLLLLLWLLLLPLPGPAAEPGEYALRNRLAGHPVAYLAQHGADPVAWQEWNAETLARARRENKPLLVSVGYFACHWCHVMQQESWRDPALAALINRHFIPVKVDRELHPALDASLLEFTRRLQGAAGWPYNVFITPEGYPFYAALYQPPARLRALVEKLGRHWRADSAGIRAAARDAARPRGVATHPLPADGEDLARLQTRFLEAVWREADTLQGGFGSVAKFPWPPRLHALLEIQARAPERRLAEFLETSLDAMARLGLHDPVNGGFFRYTTDPDWATPHFEKMLLDNAQLALLYHRAADVLGRPDYRDLAHATLDFMLQVLATGNGGLAGSVSALDRQGREGGAYLWRSEELRQRLSPEQFRLIQRVWGMTATASPFELGWLPLEITPPKGAERALLTAALARLKAAGRMRDIPRDSILGSGLQGLALSAFSRAGQGVPRFQRAAAGLRDYLESRLLREGELLKGRAGAEAYSGAELVDYALVIRGLLDHAPARPADRQWAGTLARQAWARFFSAEGWRRERQPLLAGSPASSALPDTAAPSASALLIGASLDLPEVVPAETLERALALATRAALAAPLDHPGSLGLLYRRFNADRSTEESRLKPQW